MRHIVICGRAAFSLVELMAVILILSLLAAVAIPLSIKTRACSAARSCKANLSLISSAEAAYALRHGAYTVQLSDLIGAPEGLAAEARCPWDGSQYTLSWSQTAKGGNGDNGNGKNKGKGNDGKQTGSTAGTGLVIVCPNQSTHEAVLPSPGGVSNYMRTLASPSTEDTFP